MITTNKLTITSKKDYHQAMAEIEVYLEKGFSNLTNDEEKRLDELSDAVEKYEEVEYPMPMDPTFRDILEYLMISNHYNQAQLSNTLAVSPALISGILSGKKSPNIDLLVNVYKNFGIDGNLLLNSIIEPNSEVPTYTEPLS